MHALIQNDTVWQLFDADPQLGPGFDVRDVSAVEGIAEGWRVEGDGYAAPPAIPTPPPAPVITYKADIYRRCTDREAEAIEMALAGAPVRERRLFESALYLDHAEPEFATMREAMVGMFGEPRAAVLLAAS